ncbi:hypothetical protein D3C87_779440 [compost metagenome]
MIERIIIIESIPEDEKKTGKELYDDIITKYIQFFNSEIKAEYYKVTSKSEFLEIIENITQNISNEIETILHIEAHGGNEEIQFSNYELLKWIELEKKLSIINAKSKNKLHLNLATCHGMHVAEKTSLIDTAPYKSFISALNELSPYEIIEDNSILYEEIIKSKDIFQGFVNFLKRQQKTQLRIKDIKTVLDYILSIQILRFIVLDPNFDLKMFFDNYLNIVIDKSHLNNLKTSDEKIKYILEIFYQRYFVN